MTKKIISVLTATRAEYGLLKPIIKKLQSVAAFDVRVVVTGAHLSAEFGLTYKEIELDGIKIDEKLEILSGLDTPAATSKAMGLAMISFADYFEKLRPDMLVVLGDRYETLAVCCVAMNQRIPIAHLYGGETTQGAVDEAIRHAITKLSYLHFTSTEEYRCRVIQLGEEPDRVFCVGAIGVENIRTESYMSKSELESELDFKLDKPYAMVTFHPVTLEENKALEQIEALLAAIKKQKNMKFIFTKANADENGLLINRLIEHFVEENDHAVLFPSLGVTKYLSALKHCTMVIGNSSSGLIEAPSFGIPTINIGDRQKGRLQASSVIDCDPTEPEIRRAISLALSDEIRSLAKNTVNPYGDGNTSSKIIDVIRDYLTNDKIQMMKKFFDCREG